MSFDAIRQVLGSLEQQEGWKLRRQMRSLHTCWADVVGAAVAAQTRPYGIQRQVLQVATSSPAWAQTLMYERSRILEKLNTRLPFQLADIRFSTAHWQYDPAPSLELDHVQVWQKHPSQIVAAPCHRSSVPADLTPEAAFWNWAGQIQARSQQLPLCPLCQCPTPPGELQRWACCSLCAAKQWSHMPESSQ